MMTKRIKIGDTIILPCDVVEIELKTVSLVTEKGWLSDRKENFRVIIIKVLNEEGLYDFYTIYNDKRIIDLLKKDKKSTLDVGNFNSYPGILNYSQYEETNMIYDPSIKCLDDFEDEYMSRVDDFDDLVFMEPRQIKGDDDGRRRITITCDDW